jgi:hypothetical protein
MNKSARLGISLLATGLAAGLAAPGLEASGPIPRNPQGLVAASYVFPSAANVQGAFGAYYKTKLVLTNPGGSPISVVATLSTPTGTPAGGIQTIALAAGETRVFGNFLSDVFSYTGGAGFLLAETSNSRPFYAVGEVYTDGGSGRFSTPLLPLSADDRVVNLANGETGLSASTALVVDGSGRANLGCANMDGTAVAVRADIYNESSAYQTPAAKVTLNLLANGWEQQSVPVSGQKIRILFWQLSAGGLRGCYCYGVNVDNQSGDGTAVPATYAPAVK